MQITTGIKWHLVLVIGHLSKPNIFVFIVKCGSNILYFITFNIGADPEFPTRGAPTYDFAKISEKLHEIEKIFGPGGGCVPLGSTTALVDKQCGRFAVIPREGAYSVKISFTVL